MITILLVAVGLLVAYWLIGLPVIAYIAWKDRQFRKPSVLIPAYFAWPLVALAFVDWSRGFRS